MDAKENLKLAEPQNGSPIVLDLAIVIVFINSFPIKNLFQFHEKRQTS